MGPHIMVPIVLFPLNLWSQWDVMVHRIGNEALLDQIIKYLCCFGHIKSVSFVVIQCLLLPLLNLFICPTLCLYQHGIDVRSTCSHLYNAFFLWDSSLNSFSYSTTLAPNSKKPLNFIPLNFFFSSIFSPFPSHLEKL